jgi:hypothetical protein
MRQDQAGEQEEPVHPQITPPEHPGMAAGLEVQVIGEHPGGEGGAAACQVGDVSKRKAFGTRSDTLLRRTMASRKKKPKMRVFQRDAP